MCQRRPADPTDPGDAADLSIMGYAVRCQPQPLVPGSARCSAGTLAQEHLKINNFLTKTGELHPLR